MTRQEAEEMIFEAAKIIEAVRREYCPDDDYLTLAIVDGDLMFNNSPENTERPIYYFSENFMKEE